MKFLVIDGSPRYVPHAVRANGHACLDQAPHLGRSEGTRLVEPSGDDEERGREVVPTQRWQGILYIRRVTVVECNANRRILADDFQELLELLGLTQ